MRTLHSYWEELKDNMQKYNEWAYVSLDARVNDDGTMKFTGFVSLGNHPDDKQTGIHDCKSPEELIQKAEGWAKIITTKLEVESKDVAL